MQEILVIVQLEDARHIKKRHWGLVPFWAKDISIGARMINARVIDWQLEEATGNATLSQTGC